MNIVIHDLDCQQFNSIFTDIPKDTQIISNGIIKNCIGCFGCWIKTPGKCVISDGYENLGEIFSKADQVIVISRCTYGCYSPFIKNVLDRAISYLLPSFEIINNETRHKPRYEKTFNYSVYFYGNDITDDEKKTAERLVEANSIGFHFNSFSVQFMNSVDVLSGKVAI